MADVVNKETRSRMMSGIRSSNTKPEILTRKALHRIGYRFKIGGKVGKIKPDIVLRSRKVAVFVHGCYWHQHEGCKLAYSHRSYSEKWKKKFRENRERDQKVTERILLQGWRVAVIWECVTRDIVILEQTVNKFNVWIEEDNKFYFESDYKKA